MAELVNSIKDFKTKYQFDTNSPPKQEGKTPRCRYGVPRRARTTSQSSSRAVVPSTGLVTVRTANSCVQLFKSCNILSSWFICWGVGVNIKRNHRWCPNIIEPNDASDAKISEWNSMQKKTYNHLWNVFLVEDAIFPLPLASFHYMKNYVFF